MAKGKQSKRHIRGPFTVVPKHKVQKFDKKSAQKSVQELRAEGKLRDKDVFAEWA